MIWVYSSISTFLVEWRTVLSEKESKLQKMLKIKGRLMNVLSSLLKLQEMISIII